MTDDRQIARREPRRVEATADVPICQCGARAYWTSTSYRQFYCFECKRTGTMHDGAVVAR